MATLPIYQFYVELEDYKPKMWRRFWITNDITVAKLAYAVMILFEIRSKYSYEIKKDELQVYLKKHPEYANHPERLKDLNKTFRKLRYGITSKNNMYMYRNKDGYENMQDATATKLKDILSLDNEEITFFYDPEINWKIKITLEKTFIDRKIYAKDLPKVIDGQGYGIIEALGGTKQLENFRNNTKNNKKINIDYAYYSTLDAQKCKLNMDKFDKEDMSFRLQKLIAMLQQRYENNWYPSDLKMNIAKRRYKVYRKKK